MTETFLRRFWRRVAKADDEACWEWTGGRLQGKGYGRLGFRGKTGYAHRVSWIIANGEIPTGLFVLHRCDHPPCVNPAHLFLGDGDANMADMVAKGRQARGDRHPSRTHPEALRRGDASPARLHPERMARRERHGMHTHPESRRSGSSNGNSRLTEAQVIEIRKACQNEKQRVVAARFDVSQHTVWQIAQRLTWKHVI